MIRINPFPSKENMSDEVLFKILEDICSAKDEKKVEKLRELLREVKR